MEITGVLSFMRLVDNELQNTTGEPDNARSISAINAAQDLLEAVLATYAKIMGTRSQVQTVAATETTAFPATLLRLDGLQPLDGNAGRPIAPIIWPLDTAGGHAPGLSWPLVASTGADGRPWNYWHDKDSIYWLPRPDAVYYFRAYGLHAVTDYTVADNTFGYPDLFAMPVAALAARILKIGLGDSTEDLFSVAQEAFSPAIRAYRRRSRSRPSARVYLDTHDT